MSEHFLPFDVFDLLPTNEPSPERVVRFNRFIENLKTNVAKKVACFVCDEMPLELVEAITEKGTTTFPTRNDLRQYLLFLGFKKCDISKGFAEIEDGLRRL